MERQFEPPELHAISLMMKASKSLPDEFWLTAAMQELACLYAKIEPLLSDGQKGTLIGCGALMARESRKEFAAEIMAGIAISRAMPSRQRPAPPATSNL